MYIARLLYSNDYEIREGALIEFSALLFTFVPLVQKRSREFHKAQFSPVGGWLKFNKTQVIRANSPPPPPPAPAPPTSTTHMQEKKVVHRDGVWRREK